MDNFRAVKCNFQINQRFLQLAICDNGLHLWKCLMIERQETLQKIHQRLDHEVDISMTIKNALDALPMQDAEFKKFGGSFTLVEQSFAFWYN